MDELSVLATKIDNVQKTLDSLFNTMQGYEEKNSRAHSEFYLRIGKLEIGFGKLQVWCSGAIFIGGILTGLLIPKIM